MKGEAGDNIIMSLIQVTNIIIKNPKDVFTAPIDISLRLCVLERIQEELKFMFVYVGSAQSSDNDQVLEQIIINELEKGELIRRLPVRHVGPVPGFR